MRGVLSLAPGCGLFATYEGESGPGDSIDAGVGFVQPYYGSAPDLGAFELIVP